MKPEEQRVAIAEACGTLKCPSTGWPLGLNSLPDYLNDLNAMAEAEKALTPEQQSQYAMVLHDYHGTPLATFWRRVICSTAAQRAEAFLRTVNKWTTP